MQIEVKGLPRLDCRLSLLMLGGHTSFFLVSDSIRISSESRLLNHTHVCGERGMWNPLGAISWGSLLEHTIDLFKREALSLRNKDIGVDETRGTERTPDEEDFGSKVGLSGILPNQIRSDNSDDTIPIHISVLHFYEIELELMSLPKPIRSG
jgi:hypothetical protein